MSIGLLARPLTSCAGPTATRGSVRLDYVRYSSFIITSIVVLGKPASWALSRKLPIRPCIGHSTATLIIVSTFQLGSQEHREDKGVIQSHRASLRLEQDLNPGLTSVMALKSAASSKGAGRAGGLSECLFSQSRLTGQVQGAAGVRGHGCSTHLVFPTGVSLLIACSVLPQLMLLPRHTAFLHFPLGRFKDSVPAGRHLPHPRGSSAEREGWRGEASLAKDHTQVLNPKPSTDAANAPPQASL